MGNLIAGFSMLVAVVCGLFLKGRQDKKVGRDKEKLLQAQEVLNDVEQSKNAYDRLDDNQRQRLRERYNRD